MVLGLSENTRRRRFREGMRQLEEMYGRKLFAWELPTLAELEPDFTKRSLILAVVAVSIPNFANRTRKIALKNAAALKCQAIAEEWGL